MIEEHSASDGTTVPTTTSTARAFTPISALRTFHTSVTVAVDIHPHLRRITFAGGDLTTFAPVGPDTFLYLLLPPPGKPGYSIDADFSWEKTARLPEEDRPVGAYYTVRSWRPETAELDMLFVLHEPSGPASDWATRAQPGDPAVLWGPRGAFEPPADTEWYALIADDTGLPGVAAIIETLSPTAPVFVVAEVDNPAERQLLPDHSGLDVHWLYRRGQPPGTDPHRLLHAVQTLVLPEGPGYVWGGGESRAMTAVRRHVRDERGLGRHQVSLTAYWRHADSPVPTADD